MTVCRSCEYGTFETCLKQCNLHFQSCKNFTETRKEKAPEGTQGGGKAKKTGRRGVSKIYCTTGKHWSKNQHKQTFRNTRW